MMDEPLAVPLPDVCPVGPFGRHCPCTNPLGLKKHLEGYLGPPFCCRCGWNLDPAEVTLLVPPGLCGHAYPIHPLHEGLHG